MLGCWPLHTSSANTFPDHYDDLIRESVDDYWSDYPYWHAWKAQLYQESWLRSDVVSPVGAAGVAQFMPGTWQDVRTRMGLSALASPHVAKYAIPAGAYYMRQLRRQWRSPRPLKDRNQLAQASYNAGLGNLLDAQKACRREDGTLPNLYLDIEACLPQITGHHSEETMTYVRRIDRYWQQMRWLD